MFWNINIICVFIFSIQNIKSNCYFVFINFFPVISFWWKIYFFEVTSINKKFIFCWSFRIFSYFFIMWCDCCILKASIIFFYLWDFLLLFGFLSSQENLFMIHYDSDLFYDFYYTINEGYRRQPHYLSLIANCFDNHF